MNLADRLVALAGRVKRGLILNYHTLSAEQTWEQIALWGRHFDFIHHDELGKRLERPGKKPFCLMTFDDGKKSNVTETAPVLARLGVPAVFYVVTKFVSGELPVLWFDSYRAFLKQLGQCPKGLEPLQLKRLPQHERLERLENAYRAHGFRVNPDGDSTAPLNWDEARQLQKQGHTIGAHSETHAILTTVPSGEAEGEIARSITTVSNELGTPCASFAFPNGNHTDELARYALGCGVRTVMTTDPTWIGPAEQPWRLPRVQIYETQTLSRHRLKVLVASLGWLLANPDGTGRRYVRNRAGKMPGPAAAPDWGLEGAALRHEPDQPKARTAVGSAGD
jgi:peptidoglycan/xylan/chitin deacetylase (PgdA/CDA1 family)